MRLFFNRITFRKGEFTILKESNGIEDPGILKGEPKNNSSVYNVMKNIVYGTDQCHAYVLAHVHNTNGVFRDHENSRITWICSSKAIENDGCIGETPIAIQAMLSKMKVPIDVVISTSPVAGRLSQLAIDWKDNVPLVNRYDSGFDGSAATKFEWMATKKNGYHEFVSSCFAGCSNVFLCQSQKNALIKEYVSQLSPNRARDVLSRMYVVRNPVNFDKLDAVRVETPFSRTVGSFYRMTQLKGTRDVVDMYAKMYVLGSIDAAVITSGTKFIDSLPEMPSSFELRDLCSREDYLNLAQKTKVVVYNSMIESDPTVPVELSYLGVVPVLVNKPWAHDAFKGWPLIFNSMSEASVMVSKVLESEESYRMYA
jgi:hypothetical protein